MGTAPLKFKILLVTVGGGSSSRGTARAARRLLGFRPSVAEACATFDPWKASAWCTYVVMPTYQDMGIDR